MRLLLCVAVLPLGGCVVSPSIPSWRSASAEQITLSASQDFIVPAEINGHPVRLRVDTGYSGIVLNPAAASRVGLKPSPFENDLLIGSIRVNGDTGVGTVTINSARDERRIVWFKKDVVSDADGVINIAHLPYQSVTLQLRETAQHEVSTSIETTPMGFWSVAYSQPVAGKEVEVRLLLDAPRTLITAAAGAHLAEQHAGTWAGDPTPHLIQFGVSRPVRPMTFGRPVPLGIASLRNALVRTADYRGRYALPTDPPADPSEIVVTAAGGKSRPLFTAIIGRDQLGHCSSISYTRPTRTLTLRCRAS